MSQAKNIDVKQIVKEYLDNNGYVGLYTDFDPEGCACSKDDLMPCDSEGIPDCRPGIKIVSEDPEFDFLIGPK